MLEIEQYPCTNQSEASKRERYWVESLHATLNKQVPSRSHKEWTINHKSEYKNYFHNYYVENKEYYKEYYKANEAKIEKMRRTIYICKCGVFHMYSDKARHLRTKKHIDRVKLFETVDAIISHHQHLLTM